MQGQPREALIDLSRTIALKPNHAGAYRTRGMIQFGLRDWTKAAEDLARAAELNPDWLDLHNRAAWLLATHPDPERRDVRRALTLAQKAVDGDPHEPTYWNTLGVARYRAGQWNEAIEALSQSMDLAHGRYESFDTFPLAMAHWRLGHRQEAGDLYARALRWMEQNMPNDEELRRFCAEAAEVLGLDIPSAPR
jgi:tetratricopeptide (TPR) repeat protein